MNSVLIIGLPGAGKSFLANQKYVKEGYVLIDDPKNKNLLNKCIKNKSNIVITDPHLCSPKNRKIAIDYLEYFGYKVECIYFENNIQKCKNNIKHRNDKRKIDGLESFGYVIPDGAKVMEIWQNN